MKIYIAILIILCSLGIGCHKHMEPQYIAGYVTAINDTQITLDVPDSTPSKRLFIIDNDTSYDEGTYYEGNIAEVLYMPAEKEGESPTAISITSDPTYPRILGHWRTDKDDKLRIDIILQPRGKVLQIAPTDILQFNYWQLTGVENEITLHGTLSLPPIKDSDKHHSKENDDVSTLPTRRTMHFSSTARLTDDEEGNTEQHKVLIVTTDKGRKSKLYPAGQESY